MSFLIKKKFLFLPLFFPKFFDKLVYRVYPKPLVFDEFGKPISLCSSPQLHCFSGFKCVWCGILKNGQEQSYSVDSPLRKDSVSAPDFNSSTTATVNVLKPIVSDVSDVPLVSEFASPEVMNLNGVKAYCMHCKSQVNVLDAKYSVEESRRGVRNYLKGSCSVCKSKICAIVKKS
jgi:hypothetical protein